MIAKVYRAFEPKSITIRSCSIDIIKTNVVFLRYNVMIKKKKNPHILCGLA